MCYLINGSNDSSHLSADREEFRCIAILCVYRFYGICRFLYHISAYISFSISCNNPLFIAFSPVSCNTDPDTIFYQIDFWLFCIFRTLSFNNIFHKKKQRGNFLFVKSVFSVAAVYDVLYSESACIFLLKVSESAVSKNNIAKNRILYYHRAVLFNDFRNLRKNCKLVFILIIHTSLPLKFCLASVVRKNIEVAWY